MISPPHSLGESGPQLLRQGLVATLREQWPQLTLTADAIQGVEGGLDGLSKELR